ncbi:MAG: CHAD domain-containing protein [Bacteroidales bacterium]|nr:CHAD domain-containing protein [Bacteroidales bacterium]
MERIKDMTIEKTAYTPEDFSIRPHVAIVDEIIRIMSLQMDVSIELSECGPYESGESIHEIRKYFKKLRALTRLVKNAFGPQTYEQENYHYRNLGRLISPLRDGAIFIEVWDKLLNDTSHKSLVKPIYEGIKESLTDAMNLKIDQFLIKEDPLSLIRRGLISAKERLISTPGFAPTLTILKQGLTDTFQTGKTAMQNAINDPNIENLHEWRKQVKYLMYQLDTIQKIAKGIPDQLYTDFDVLSDLLGDDHDYAELAKELENHLHVLQYDEYLEKLRNIIDNDRIKKQQDAWPIGDKLYNNCEAVILSSLE